MRKLKKLLMRYAPAGRPEKIRDAHFPAVRCPTLLVQGTRDPLCGLDALRRSLQKLPVPPLLHVIEEGDHAFKVPQQRERAGPLDRVRDCRDRGEIRL